MRKIRLKFPRLIFALNVVFAVLLILICVCAFIPQFVIPPITVFSLFVPILLLLNTLFLVFWLIKNSKKVFLSMTAIILAYLTFGKFYKLDNGENGTHQGLSVMTYNVWGFNINEWIEEPNIGEKIINFIKSEDPDILCIQEHNRLRNEQLSEYPYKIVTPYSMDITVQAIFSKYPIIASEFLKLPNTTNGILYADVVHQTDTIRVYNLHLESYKIIPASTTLYEGEQEKYYKRLITTFRKQIEQVQILSNHVDKSPYPVIISGDFNNTQFSNPYRLIANGFSDTFLEKGNGLGKTYDLFGLPLRIDYILADPSFEVLTHQNFDVKLSDHYPVMATLKLK